MAFNCKRHGFNYDMRSCRANVFTTWSKFYTDGNISAAANALLNLTGTAAANQLPYLSSASAASLTTLTAFARTILAAASGSAMFTAMGFTSGSGWFRLPSGNLVQWGTTAGTTDAGGVLNIGLPTAFSSGSSYNCLAWNGDYNITGIVSNVRSGTWPAAGGFAVRWREPATNGLQTGQARRADWVAVGT